MCMVGAGEQKLCPAGDGTKFSDDKFVMVDRIMVQYIVLLKLPRVIDEVVTIHKAQGLEYDSVKVIIPQSNSEKITHGIFYTAITRAKKKLKIYWSAETMKEIVSGFATNESNGKSLEIVKAKLAVTQ